MVALHGPLSVLASLDRPSATASSLLRGLSPVDPSGAASLREREGRFGVKVRGRNGAAQVIVQTTSQTRVVLRGSWLCGQGGRIPWTTRLVSSQAPGPSRAAAHCRGGREDRPHG